MTENLEKLISLSHAETNEKLNRILDDISLIKRALGYDDEGNDINKKIIYP